VFRKEWQVKQAYTYYVWVFLHLILNYNWKSAPPSGCCCKTADILLVQLLPLLRWVEWSQLFISSPFTSVIRLLWLRLALWKLNARRCHHASISALYDMRTGEFFIIIFFNEHSYHLGRHCWLSLPEIFRVAERICVPQLVFSLEEWDTEISS
jgi:hypothetical protein